MPSGETGWGSAWLTFEIQSRVEAVASPSDRGRQRHDVLRLIPTETIPNAPDDLQSFRNGFRVGVNRPDTSLLVIVSRLQKAVELT